uniref:Uncharacterized protein n=1 Tax=Pipistrellus kuhlii TaxID=59472 RepID=A0A7J8B175_PIPKU|nr:hypothetical protein mPipKuh1_007673 [Pipistrellus kuhlii]
MLRRQSGVGRGIENEKEEEGRCKYSAKREVWESKQHQKKERETQERIRGSDELNSNCLDPGPATLISSESERFLWVSGSSEHGARTVLGASFPSCPWLSYNSPNFPQLLVFGRGRADLPGQGQDPISSRQPGGFHHGAPAPGRLTGESEQEGPVQAGEAIGVMEPCHWLCTFQGGAYPATSPCTRADPPPDTPSGKTGVPNSMQSQRERERDRNTDEREASISCLLHTPHWECGRNQGTCP